MFRRLLPVTVVAASLLSAPPGHAAPKATVLYFANTDSGGQWTPVLQTKPSQETTEYTAAAAVNGQYVIGGATLPEMYATGRRLGLKIDGKRKVTGQVHAICRGVATGNQADTRRVAGYVDLTVTFELNRSDLGSVHVVGTVMPGGTVSAPFEFAIPSSLKNALITKVTASVEWYTTGGLCAISLSEPGRSVVTIPTR